MIRIVFLIKIFFASIFFPQIANSLTSSSSYLIINAAITSNDYETAVSYFSDDDFFDLNIIENKIKLISFVNTSRLKEAAKVAEKIINSEINDQDAWIVFLVDAKLKNDFTKFNDFESLDNKLDVKNEFKIINYAFYNDNKIIKDNHKIAEGLLSIVQEFIIKEFDQKNIDYLLFYLSLALNLNPEFNEAIFLQAQFFQHLNNYAKAEQIYNSIQQNHTLYLEGQKNIILNREKSGKFDEAEKLLINLININSNNHTLVILLADLYRTNSIYDKAIKHYTSVLNADNIDNEQLWRIYYKRGISFERSNIWEKAENDFLKALELDSEQPQVLNYLAYGWIERNLMIDKSIEMLELAVSKNSENYYILDSLAWAYYKKNKLLKAVKIMEKVIRIAPAEAISLDHLGDIYLKLGRKREAYFMWMQAKALSEPIDDIIDSIQLKIDKFNAG